MTHAKRILLFILVLLPLLCGCGTPLPSTSVGGVRSLAQLSNPPTASAVPSDATDVTDAGAQLSEVRALPRTPNAGDADETVCGTRMEYVSPAERETWRAPLERLLSNVLLPVREERGSIGYAPAVDESAPAIEEAYAYGLYDLTLDGVPELVTVPAGGVGTTGSCLYTAYDILTGEHVATLSSVYGEPLVTCYRTEDGSVCSASEYLFRRGSLTAVWVLFTVCEDKETSEYSTRYYGQEHLRAHFVYRKEGESGRVTISTSPQGGVLHEKELYYVDENAVTAEEYYAALSALQRTLIPLPATEMTLLPVERVPLGVGKQEYLAWGRDVADALLSLDQEFLAIAPAKK